MKRIFLPFLIFGLVTMISCKGKIDKRTINFPKEKVYIKQLPKKGNFWIFIMAGQSNMAGRGFVEPKDTIPSSRVYTLDKENNWIMAKEPLHFYEPSLTGLDCGLSFGKELSFRLNDSIFIGLIPCAVGGSSVEQWLGDSLFRGVKLLTNFTERTEFASKYGTIKGILWHQGENNANKEQFKNYKDNLESLFKKFRIIAQNDSLPIFAGELGSFLSKQEFSSYPDSINNALNLIAIKDKNVHVIQTNDLKHKGDSLHFDSESQRLLGKRIANKIEIK